MSGDVSRKKKCTLIFFFFWYVWTLKTLKHLFTALGQNICIKHSKKWANVISTVWRSSGVDVTLSKDVYVLCNRDVHWSHTVSVTERFIFLSKQKNSKVHCLNSSFSPLPNCYELNCLVNSKHTPIKVSNEVKLAKTVLVCRPTIILRFGGEYAGRDGKIFLQGSLNYVLTVASRYSKE